MLTFALGALAALGLATTAPAGAARRVPVEFRSGGERMVGTLFVPEGSDQKRPAVVVVGPWLNVKEQVAYNYAERLAAKGFAALAFDFRHWGESGGEPREYESPAHKVEDIRAAVAFLKTRPEVAPDRLGLLGVCFGVGYVGEAAADPSVKAVGTVAAWVHDRATVEDMFGKEEVERRLRVGAEAKETYAKDKRVIYVPAYSPTDKEAAMFFPGDGFYYNAKAKRGAIPQWTNQYAVLGWQEWIDYDGVSKGALITQPLMSVHSDNSALPNKLREFYAKAKGPKELVWLEGEHTQFYDTEPYIDRAVEALARHFTKTLGAEEQPVRPS